MIIYFCFSLIEYLFLFFYVPTVGSYKELLAALDALMKHTDNKSTKAAIQVVYDDIVELLTALRQKDGTKVSSILSKLAKDLKTLYSLLNDDEPTQKIIQRVLIKLKQLIVQSKPLINKIPTLNDIVIRRFQLALNAKAE